jgi:hypothetical protein
MVAEPFVVRLLSWCVQVHVMYLIVLISQTKEIKAASLLQIRAFEELLSLVLNYFWTIMWKTNGSATILFKDRVFSRNNATQSTLRLGRTPRTSGPEIKSEKYDGYQHNFTSHSMTKRRKQPMSAVYGSRVKVSNDLWPWYHFQSNMCWLSLFYEIAEQVANSLL